MFLKRLKSNGKLPAIPEGCYLGSLTTTGGNSVPYGTGESAVLPLVLPQLYQLFFSLSLKRNDEITRVNADRLKKKHWTEVIRCDTFEANRY
ncbi:hypothetical protein C8N47_107115 [Mangrovibacterium marinum]|uniref:Uncharacterized protein n=1 Tax=Mangrovibacterium marinum TaxID=1639118 RepID=A0A2T5C256_9BACT|nr:hypothetical protein C8N47_107115 [Mangrovibacterium marinum]